MNADPHCHISRRLNEGGHEALGLRCELGVSKLDIAMAPFDYAEPVLPAPSLPALKC